MKNRTFRVFVSSTFNDFLSERQCLSEEIFQVIGDYCQSRGYNFQFIDLRWGISEEAALNQKTMPICLDEVRRCHIWSPKPNFLLMVGERYGWIPLPFVIKKSEFEQLLQVCSSKDRKLLEQWYWFDGNTIGGEYYLRPRQGEYMEEEKWNKVQEDLQCILIDAAEKCHLPPQDLIRYTASATEQEIIEGFLGNSNICDNTIAVFRNGYKYRDVDQTKINDLRHKIKDKMSQDGVIDNLFELDYGNNYIIRFCKTVTSALMHNIEKEISRLEQLNASQEKEILLTSLPSIGEREFYGRSNELSLLNEYIVGREQKPLFVIGESGSGKSTLLAEFVRYNIKNCFFSFYGTDDFSYSIFEAIGAICHRIRAHYSIDDPFFLTPYNLIEAFWDTVLAIPPGELTIILIDGLDMFQNQAKMFNPFMLPELPENVKLIVSISSEATSIMQELDDSHVLRISSFTPKDSRAAFVQMLHAQGHCLSNPNQKRLVDNILGEKCLPLQIRLMSDICSDWRSDDYKMELPDTPEGSAMYYIRSMFESFGHDKELVLYSLAFILAAPYGIGEDDLQILLPKVDVIRERFVSSSYHTVDASKLPYAIWSRLFFDLGKCLQLVNVKGYIVVRVCHSIFSRVFLESYPSYYEKARDILISHYVQLSNYLDNKKMIPNKKKCISILPLLLDAGMLEDVDTLLQDITFVDASCKSGCLDEVLSAFHIRIPQVETAPLRTKLITIETFLLRNRDTLDYYRGSVFSYLDAEGLCNSFSPTISCILGTSTPAQYVRLFPYSTSSLLAWSSDGTTLAVAHGRYIHLIKGATWEEFQTIYTAALSQKAYTISNILWPSSRHLAVQMTNQTINIYHIEGTNTQHIFTIEDASSEVKAVTNGEGILLYCTGSGIRDFLCAFSVFLGKEVYRMRLGITNTGNNISIIEDNLIVINGILNWRVDFYDVSTGKRIRQIYIQRSLVHSTYLNPVSTNLLCLGDNDWLFIPTANSNRYRIGQYRGSENGSNSLALQYYYYPPQDTQIMGYLAGKNSVIIIYQNRLIWIEPATDLSMYSLKIENILRVVWRKKDQSLSVLCRDNFLEITRTEFLSTNPIGLCFVSKKALMSFQNTLPVFRELFSDLHLRLFGKLFRRFYDYRFVFSHWACFSIGEENIFPESATLLIFASDGKYAAAYEGLDKIVIFDPNHQPLLILKNLKLAIINSILKMAFSNDSRFFLLWRNCSLEVFSLDVGRCIVKLNLSWRPALFVSFSKDSSHLEITLCDNQKYSVPLSNYQTHSKRQLPRRLIKHRGFRYTFPYIVNPFSESPGAIKLIADIDGLPSKWFKTDRLFFGDRHYLLMKDGNFYLDGDLKLRFSAPYENFTLALQAERNKDRSAVEGFLREKNDISSKVLESQNGEYLILISRMLNSVIVFDVANKTVLSSYKHHGDIIGWKSEEQQDGSFQLELYSNSAPFVRTLIIRVP